MKNNTIRWGLCCLFKNEPIHFSSRQATSLAKKPRTEQLALLSASILHNGKALQQAVLYCQRNGIGAFRINSRIFPLKTHPAVGYQLDSLPEYSAIRDQYQQVAALARQKHIRFSFHPDQFTLLSSPNPDITRRSLAELTYQAEAAALLGADVITLHGGGAYGNKTTALQRVASAIQTLPAIIRDRLALENDDKIYTPGDLLPLCEQCALPFVYDVHHHRCLPDHLTIAEVTKRACATWNREPLFHLSSPREGWQGNDPKPHHDYIMPTDFPPEWRGLHLTIEVEAKAKELALQRIVTQSPSI